MPAAAPFPTLPSAVNNGEVGWNPVLRRCALQPATARHQAHPNAIFIICSMEGKCLDGSTSLSSPKSSLLPQAIELATPCASSQPKKRKHQLRPDDAVARRPRVPRGRKAMILAEAARHDRLGHCRSAGGSTWSHSPSCAGSSCNSRGQTSAIAWSATPQVTGSGRRRPPAP
jgi:hypothetical protein